MIEVFTFIESGERAGERVSIVEFEDDRVREALALAEVLYEESGATHFVKLLDGTLYVVNEDGIPF